MLRASQAEPDSLPHGQPRGAGSGSLSGSWCWVYPEHEVFQFRGHKGSPDTIGPGIGYTSLSRSQNNYLQAWKLLLGKLFAFFHIWT